MFGNLQCDGRSETKIQYKFHDRFLRLSDKCVEMTTGLREAIIGVTNYEVFCQISNFFLQRMDESYIM